MPRYPRKFFTNDHKLAGFSYGDWLKWRWFLRDQGMVPRK
jgi:hypothetical protein